MKAIVIIDELTDLPTLFNFNNLPITSIATHLNTSEAAGERDARLTLSGREKESNIHFRGAVYFFS